MKSGLMWAGRVLLVMVIAIAGMAIFNLCPPDGPWPQPPWCSGSPFNWPFSEPEDVLEEEPTPFVPVVTESREEALVSMAQSLFLSLTSVQTYYDQGLQAMVQFLPGGGGGPMLGGYPGGRGGGRLACVRPFQGSVPFNIPEGFTGPLAEDGFIPAPEGACAAGVRPEVRFVDQSGEPVTGERLAEEEVSTIEFDALTGQNPEVQSLERIISNALQPGDMRLTTAEGWNEALWDSLAGEQQPMDSLMEYQLWNSAETIETLVADSIEARMRSMGIPEVVIEAFRQSDYHGWFASRHAEAENALASMEIIAAFDGDFNGIIEEERSFTLAEPGEMPEFGPMTGSGEIVFDHPTLGEMNFEVEFEWSAWDELGRVNGGELRMLDASAGYEIQISFLPDGTKEGEVLVDGEIIGGVEIIVDGTETSMEFIPKE